MNQPIHSFGLYLYSAELAPAQGLGQTSGCLCLGQTFGRLGAQQIAYGQSTLELAPLQFAQVSVLPSTTFQAWFRSPISFGGQPSGLTNSVTVTWRP